MEPQVLSPESPSPLRPKHGASFQDVISGCKISRGHNRAMPGRYPPMQRYSAQRALATQP